DGLLEALVGLEVVKEGERGALRGGDHEDGRAGDADDVFAARDGGEIELGDGGAVDLFLDLHAGGFRGVHDREDGEGDRDGQPAAGGELGKVRTEEDQVGGAEAEAHEGGEDGVPTPAAVGDEEEREGRDRHGGGHGDAVGG